jgi:hypothetical protein
VTAPAVTLRLARSDDVPALEALIALSARALQAATYSPAQIEGALGTVFAVDRQLIADGTYFVAERDREMVGCGGWSRRKTLFGGDRGRSPLADPLLDPKRDAADAGFHAMELVATLAGEPLYAAFAFRAVERYDVALANGLSLPVVRMAKALPAST